MTEYLFNTRKNQHFFCMHCGVRAFGVGNDTPIGRMYGVNIGCMEGVSEDELSRIPVTYVDGLHDRWQEVPAFVALLRGVNVGKARRVPMVEFRSTLTGLGYTGVATLLNSGNAVFRATSGTPARHAARIAVALAAHVELDVPVIVKSTRELATIVAECPVKADPSDHSCLLVAFVQEPKALAATHDGTRLNKH